MVGMMRIELTTFCPPDKRANQAALHPDLFLFVCIIYHPFLIFQAENQKKIQNFCRILKK